MYRILLAAISLIIFSCDNSTAPTDCAGVVNGTAVVDDCGVCDGDGVAQACGCGSTGEFGISDGECDCDGNIEDCAGVCGGSATTDDCEACELAGNIFDCAGICDGSAIVDCAGECGGSAVLSGCDNECNSTAVEDCEGVCGGNADCSTATDLEGTWIGNEPAGYYQGAWVFTISGNAISVAPANPEEWSEWYVGTFTINTQTNPKQFDIVITDCVSSDYIGTTALGIYMIENNILTFSGNEPGATIRPTNFTEGGRVFILTKQP